MTLLPNIQQLRLAIKPDVHHMTTAIEIGALPIDVTLQDRNDLVWLVDLNLDPAINGPMRVRVYKDQHNEIHIFLSPLPLCKTVLTKQLDTLLGDS